MPIQSVDPRHTDAGVRELDQDPRLCQDALLGQSLFEGRVPVLLGRSDLQCRRGGRVEKDGLENVGFGALGDEEGWWGGGVEGWREDRVVEAWLFFGHA